MNSQELIDFIHPWSWLVGSSSIFLLYLIYWYQRPHNFPPGPRGIPLVGYLPFLSKKAESDIYKLSKKYGPVMSVRMGATDLVVLNDFESIKKAFVKNGSHFSGRGRFANLEGVKKGYGLVFCDYNDTWKVQRKFGLLTLRGFGLGKQKLESICLQELQSLNQEIRNRNGKPFNISTSLSKALANLICCVTMGRRYDYDDKEFLEMLRMILNRFDDSFLSVIDRLIIMIPKLKFIPPINYFHRKYEILLAELINWVEKIVTEQEKVYDENNIRGFIDVFIQEKRKGTEPSFTSSQLVNYIEELFVAGSETSSSMLCWAILCLLHYPETQEKLRKEIYEVFGSLGVISTSKKSEMPYTNAFIQELLRFRTVSPMSIPHKTNADVNLNNHFIPEGTTVLSNLWAVHNDPNLWKDPEIFNPERFLDEQGNFIKSNHVVPFSIGPRHCLGEQLAKMELFVLLVGMVQKFEFLPEKSGEILPELQNGNSGILFTPFPYSVIAKEI